MTVSTHNKLGLLAVHAAAVIMLAACGGGSSDGGATATATASERSSTVREQAAAASTDTALTPVAATASASERGDLSAAAAIDHDENTRWGSGFTDNQYLTLDYGKAVTITRVRIDWERAHATQYLLQVSNDGASWTTIKAVDNSQGGIEDWTLLNGQGRYLRMQGIKRSSGYG